MISDRVPRLQITAVDPRENVIRFHSRTFRGGPCCTGSRTISASVHCDLFDYPIVTTHIIDTSGRVFFEGGGRKNERSIILRSQKTGNSRLVLSGAFDNIVVALLCNVSSTRNDLVYG
jgi:hypothetical protein